VAPAGLREDLKSRYVEALRRVAADAGFAGEARKNGFGVDWRFDADFGRYMEEDDERFGRIIRLLNAKQPGEAQQ
jgi:hypothetical protein